MISHLGVPTRNCDGAHSQRIWLYLDAEVLVLPPVFLPQEVLSKEYRREDQYLCIEIQPY